MLLKAVDVEFGYRTRGTRPAPAPAIAGVSIDIAAGAIVGVLGPNGSGKTTLIRLLSGAVIPSAGSVSFDGRPIRQYPRAELARRIAVVPQETHLAFDYTALEIVLMGRYPRLGVFEIEGPNDIASALDALAATGTRDLAARAFPTLSGGEKQRVIIASALAQLDDDSREPSVLFLDEPTASLDLRYRLELGALVRRLNRDRRITIVISTHDLALAAAHCTDVVLLSQGRVLAAGSPREVLTAPLVGQLYQLDTELVAPALP